MKIATWNINGIRARHAQVVEWAAGERPDVFCLQEIKASPQQAAETSANLPEYWNHWHGAAGGYSGVSLHLRRQAFVDPPVFSYPAFDRESRIVEARVRDCVFASTYFPNGGKDYDAKLRFLEASRDYATELQAAGKRLFLCGDLNVARADVDVHPSQRRPGIIGQRDDERALLESLLSAGLVDVARALHPADERFFTWWPNWRTARARNLGWRIDFILAHTAAIATSCIVRREVGTSDHAPLVAIFQDHDADGG